MLLHGAQTIYLPSRAAAAQIEVTIPRESNCSTYLRNALRPISLNEIQLGGGSGIFDEKSWVGEG
jgi:hypothetical protein